MAFYTIMIQVFEQGVISDITTRNCNRHTQRPLDLLLSESTSMLEARASVACNVFKFATRKIPVLAT